MAIKKSGSSELIGFGTNVERMWYYLNEKEGDYVGPYANSEFKILANKGVLQPSTKIRCGEQHLLAGDIDGLVFQPPPISEADKESLKPHSVLLMFVFGLTLSAGIYYQWIMVHEPTVEKPKMSVETALVELIQQPLEKSPTEEPIVNFNAENELITIDTAEFEKTPKAVAIIQHLPWQRVCYEPQQFAEVLHGLGTAKRKVLLKQIHSLQLLDFKGKLEQQTGGQRQEIQGGLILFSAEANSQTQIFVDGKVLLSLDQAAMSFDAELAQNINMRVKFSSPRGVRSFYLAADTSSFEHQQRSYVYSENLQTYLRKDQYFTSFSDEEKLLLLHQLKYESSKQNRALPKSNRPILTAIIDGELKWYAPVRSKSILRGTIFDSRQLKMLPYTQPGLSFLDVAAGLPSHGLKSIKLVSPKDCSLSFQRMQRPLVALAADQTWSLSEVDLYDAKLLHDNKPVLLLRQGMLYFYTKLNSPRYFELQYQTLSGLQTLYVGATRKFIHDGRAFSFDAKIQAYYCTQPKSEEEKAVGLWRQWEHIDFDGLKRKQQKDYMELEQDLQLILKNIRYHDHSVSEQVRTYHLKLARAKYIQKILTDAYEPFNEWLEEKYPEYTLISKSSARRYTTKVAKLEKKVEGFHTNVVKLLKLQKPKEVLLRPRKILNGEMIYAP